MGAWHMNERNTCKAQQAHSTVLLHQTASHNKKAIGFNPQVTLHGLLGDISGNSLLGFAVSERAQTTVPVSEVIRSAECTLALWIVQESI
eukprot:jgi/Botrbrau1/1506/Bobra.178_3s0058.1